MRVYVCLCACEGRTHFPVLLVLLGRALPLDAKVNINLDLDPAFFSFSFPVKMLHVRWLV